jgi:hypothetical protein
VARVVRHELRVHGRAVEDDRRERQPEVGAVEHDLRAAPRAEVAAVERRALAGRRPVAGRVDADLLGLALGHVAAREGAQEGPVEGLDGDVVDLRRREREGHGLAAGDAAVRVVDGSARRDDDGHRARRLALGRQELDGVRRVGRHDEAPVRRREERRAVDLKGHDVVAADAEVRPRDRHGDAALGRGLVGRRRRDDGRRVGVGFDGDLAGDVDREVVAALARADAQHDGRVVVADHGRRDGAVRVERQGDDGVEPEVGARDRDQPARVREAEARRVHGGDDRRVVADADGRRLVRGFDDQRQPRALARRRRHHNGRVAP